MKLLSKKQCPFCWQVKIALTYLDIEYELEEYKVPDKDLLLQYSPQGSSPILLHDDVAVWDSVAIIHYLEDILSGSKTLFPGAVRDRNKARLLHTYNNSIAGKGLREVVFEKRSNPEAEWDMERINQGMKIWIQSLDWLETRIESTDHFLSAGFSMADAALLPRFGIAEFYGVGVGKDHPKLYDWFRHGREQHVYENTISL